MFYDKLPIMVLSEMVSGESDSTNGHLAAYILDHLNELREDSIRDLSAKTHVSISSISRFCRDIGLQDFAELKELIATTSLDFEINSDSKDLNVQKSDYISAVEDSLEHVRRSLDMRKLERLAQDIQSHERVYIFGILKGETAAMNLQTDLAMLGKRAVTKLRFSHQAQILSESGPDDLIILFSFAGIFFNYGYPRLTAKKKSQRAKVYFITSDRRAVGSREFDDVIWFDSLQNQASHPYQLQLIAGLIAQSYGHLLLEEREGGGQ